MHREHVKIEINGKDIADIYEHFIQLEVELDCELASMMRFQLEMPKHPDGTWPTANDERFRIWNKVRVMAGFEQGLDCLFTGYITNIKPLFDPCKNQGVMEIWALDESILLDRQEHLRAWPGKTDNDIVAEILKKNAMAGTDSVSRPTEHGGTAVVHNESISTIIQRETDLGFIRRLAQRNGYEFFVEEGTGYFKPPGLDAAPQPTLAFFFGDETNLDKLELNVHALKPTTAHMYQLDRLTRDELEAVMESGDQTRMGSSHASDLLPPDISIAQTVVRLNAATGLKEMKGLCREIVNMNEWFVEGEGIINGNKYGHVLKPRRPVTIKGIGDIYSGTYYVTYVRHVFSREGYGQHFRVKRNALVPTGKEKFVSDNEPAISDVV